MKHHVVPISLELREPHGPLLWRCVDCGDRWSQQPDHHCPVTTRRLVWYTPDPEQFARWTRDVGRITNLDVFVDIHVHEPDEPCVMTCATFVPLYTGAPK